MKVFQDQLKTCSDMLDIVHYLGTVQLKHLTLPSPNFIHNKVVCYSFYKNWVATSRNIKMNLRNFVRSEMSGKHTTSNHCNRSIAGIQLSG